MNLQVKIAPSILSADPGCYAQEIKEISNAGADWIHIDVMDGSFVPPITFGDNIVKVARKNSSLFLDTHLMVVNPEKHFDSFKAAGSDRIIFHLEATKDVGAALRQIRLLGIKNGLCIKPETPVQTVAPFLQECDLVLVMSVNPGWGGQKFMPESLPKISWLREQADKLKLNFEIEVDGGINAETAALCLKAGASALVAGNYVFTNPDRASAINSLRPSLLNA